MEAKAARSPRFQDFHVHVTACTLFSLPAYTYIYKIKQNNYSNKAYCYDLGQNAMRRFGLQCHKVLECLADGACSEKARLLETCAWRRNLNSRLVLCVFPGHQGVRVIFLHSLPHSGYNVSTQTPTVS